MQPEKCFLLGIFVHLAPAHLPSCLMYCIVYRYLTLLIHSSIHHIKSSRYQNTDRYQEYSQIKCPVPVICLTLPLIITTIFTFLDHPSPGPAILEYNATCSTGTSTNLFLLFLLPFLFPSPNKATPPHPEKGKTYGALLWRARAPHLTSLVYRHSLPRACPLMRVPFFLFPFFFVSYDTTRTFLAFSFFFLFSFFSPAGLFRLLSCFSFFSSPSSFCFLSFFLFLSFLFFPFQGGWCDFLLSGTWDS
ncbi:hypothetical protein HOY80DRAFT_767819 [Tuber brumale]|nr:hypothetical protein HOY80DRAFT_767819 [Tuber brumale]